jgi:hypothetical protein
VTLTSTVFKIINVKGERKLQRKRKAINHSNWFQ